MRLAQAGGERLVVLAQLGQHVQRLDVVGIVVQHALRARDVADGLSVVPPTLRMRSAIGSVIAKSWSACSSSSRW